jgi:prepilin-type processing-associated H-X9-DG protein
VELLVVIGIIAILVAILLPALNKARKQANTTVCMSNLRQMGVAWNLYLSDTKGRLPYYIWHNSPSGLTPALTGDALASYVWHGYWVGLLCDYRIPSNTLLCPEATMPVQFNTQVTGNGGFGMAFNSWSGAFQSSTPVGIAGDKNRVPNDTTDKITSNGTLVWGYRYGSYGFNRNVMVDGPDNTVGHPLYHNNFDMGATIAQLRPSGDIPLFFDSVWVDGNSMTNGTLQSQPNPPADLTGLAAAGAGSGNDQWRFLITRHNYAINMCFADGHAETVSLPDTYNHLWKSGWVRYSLTNLPKK